MKAEIEENLRRTVQFLAGDIGPRDYRRPRALNRAADYISSHFKMAGYAVSHQPFSAAGNTYKNIIAEKKGIQSPENIIVIGAHYDTVGETPGADDNASGVAALLELARLLADEPTALTIQFVAFSLEEPPFFRSSAMGSYKYAESLHKTDAHVEGMICLESVGYFTERPDSQFYPVPVFRFFYPDTGNFITFVGDRRSKDFLERAKGGFQTGTDLPVESLSAYSIIPGVDFSDHRSFWKFGYNAFMVTDTAFYRNPYYHNAGDVPATLDFAKMAEVVKGLASAVRGLAE